MTAKSFQYVWEWRLAATPDALWPYVADTNRVNRDAGIPVVTELPGAAPGTRRLLLRKYGVPVQWEEEPFEWVRPHSYGVLRRYASGPVAAMRVVTTLRPDGALGCVLRNEVTATPRNILGYAAIPIEIGILSARRFGRAFRYYAELAGRDAGKPPSDGAQQRVTYLRRPARLAPGGAARLEGMRTTLYGQCPRALVDALIDVVQRADDLAVARVRPYVWADLWHVPRRAVVDVCLCATRAGIFDLQWDVLCPMCRGAKQSTHTLAGIAQPVHCDGCHIDFTANFEQAVELTFTINPAIRSVQIAPFCVGGPQVTPHIVVQQSLAAGAERVLEVSLEKGRYQLRTSAVPGARHFRVADQGAASLPCTLDSSGWPADEPVLCAAPAITLRNTTAARQLLIIERTAWSDQALTAAEVIALQEFRDLFAAEVLRPGEAINVGSMAILFTDLRDSTRMYRQVGDAPAFGRVMDHFSALRQAIQQEEGALVKTIGDAVMAVFRRPAGAIRTVLRAQQLLAAYPEGVRAGNLKAGIHFGPCIAVTLNERLDYFGSTVNIAARLGALSQGGEVIISENVARDPEVQSLLQDSDIAVMSFQAQLKGYEGTHVPLLRLQSTRLIPPAEIISV